MADEKKYAVPDHFSAHAEAYAANRPDYPDSLFRWLATAAPGRDRAWDCATGSGQAARGLVKYFDRVEATDASEQQIARAEPHPRIRYRVMPAEETDFPDAHFDLVTAAQAFHWFDRTRFYPELERVLKPGGLFATWGYNFFRATPEIKRVVDAVFLPATAKYFAENNRLAWTRFRDIDLPLEPVEAPPLPMVMRYTLDGFLAYVRTWSGVQNLIRAEGEAAWTPIEETFRQAWPDAPDKARDIPFQTYLIVRRKPV